jgi:ribose/xylose/arabinose/galactoside ABC-type transport system permease subunit
MSTITDFSDRIVAHEDAVVLILDNLVWPLLLFTFLVFSLILPGSFFTTSNISFLLVSSAAVGMLALAESICLLSGNFDLSVGSIASFSSMATAFLLTNVFSGGPGILGIILILFIGGLIGSLNGFSVAYLGVNPFLQTLAFLIIFRGATVAVSTYPITDLPESYLYLGGSNIVPSVPAAIIVLFGVFIFAGLALKYLPLGLSIYAVGSDKKSASESGIKTKRVILLVYIVSGMLCGLGGLLFTGFLGAATPSLGEGQLFPAFAAAVIGGISIFGGRGNVSGALGGVLLLGTIQAGLVMIQIDPTQIRMINGVILLIAILLYTGVEKYRRSRLDL